MRIAPEIVARHWEAAAAEQLARDLERDGYEVSRREPIVGGVAGVVARRGGEVTVYGVKSPPWDDRQADELVELRDHAVSRLGGSFKLVIATPPRDMAAEVSGLDRILLETLVDPVPDELALLSSRTEVYAVSDVEIGSIAVHPPKIKVEGSAAVLVTLRWGRGDDEAEDRESFPFTFALTLGTKGELSRVDHLGIDTRAWYGPEREDDEVDFAQR